MAKTCYQVWESLPLLDISTDAGQRRQQETRRTCRVSPVQSSSKVGRERSVRAFSSPWAVGSIHERELASLAMPVLLWRPGHGNLCSHCKNLLRFWAHWRPEATAFRQSFPALRDNRPFKPLQKGHICPTVAFLPAVPWSKISITFPHIAIHHTETERSQTPSRTCHKTSVSKPVHIRVKIRGEPDLLQLSHSVQTGFPELTHSLGFSSFNSSLLPFQGF